MLTADRWLYATLKNDTTLAAVIGARIYADIAPEGSIYPLAILSQVISLPVANWSADKVMNDEVWRVRLTTDKADYGAIETAAERIQTLLHKQTGTGVIGCTAEGITRFSEIESGQVYKHLVLEFRIFTQ